LANLKEQEDNIEIRGSFLNVQVINPDKGKVAQQIHSPNHM